MQGAGQVAIYGFGCDLEPVFQPEGQGLFLDSRRGHLPQDGVAFPPNGKCPLRIRSDCGGSSLLIAEGRLADLVKTRQIFVTELQIGH